MTGEPVFKGLNRTFWEEKKCGAYGARTRYFSRINKGLDGVSKSL